MAGRSRDGQRRSIRERPQQAVYPFVGGQPPDVQHTAAPFIVMRSEPCGIGSAVEDMGAFRRRPQHVGRESRNGQIPLEELDAPSGAQPVISGDPMSSRGGSSERGKPARRTARLMAVHDVCATK